MALGAGGTHFCTTTPEPLICYIPCEPKTVPATVTIMPEIATLSPSPPKCRDGIYHATRILRAPVLGTAVAGVLLTLPPQTQEFYRVLAEGDNGLQLAFALLFLSLGDRELKLLLIDSAGVRRKVKATLRALPDASREN
jgi:hypothetical protein